MIARGWPLLLLLGAAVGCVAGARSSSPLSVQTAEGAELEEAAQRGPLALSDALDVRFEAGTLGAGEVDWAYRRVKDAPAPTAEAAYGKAKVLARRVASEGWLAAGLLREVEALLLQSLRLDPDFRRGAAQLALGQLYVNAPPQLLRRGDSEEGLSLLEALVDRYPEGALYRLRLAEAYLILDDRESALPLLCGCQLEQDPLTVSERRLLATLFETAGSPTCPQDGATAPTR